MEYCVYLDDFRQPIDSFYFTKNPIYNKVEWKIVRNYDEFVKIITENGIPDIISLDHDLNDSDYERVANYGDDNPEKNGYHCAKWLINYCIDNNLELPKTILIHSMNPVGSQNIKSLFDSYKKSLNL